MLHMLALKMNCTDVAGFDKKLKKGKQEQPISLSLAVTPPLSPAS